MKIKVEYDVPEGKYCNNCSKHFIDGYWHRTCAIFDAYLEQYGSNILKCYDCELACKEAEVNQ